MTAARAGRGLPGRALDLRALTREDFSLLAQLFGERGACGGCWCMAWRLDRKTWERQRGQGNRRALQRLVAGGRLSGVLALSAGRAVGWCSVGPRVDFVALESKRSLATAWDERTWSVTCFFIERSWRRRGLGVRLLRAAVDLARERGATRLEGYPAPLPRSGGALPAAFAWTGLPRLFERNGFRPLPDPPGKRPIYVRRLRGALRPPRGR